MTDLPERDSRVVWHPFTQVALDGSPVAIESGRGALLFGSDGSEYIDAISSWWAVIHGHAHPYISERVADQLDKLHHVLFAGFTHEPAVALAERLIGHLPDGMARVFYSDNGSTACEVALKMSVQVWHNRGDARTRIVAFENAYHGDTFGAMSVGESDCFVAPFTPLLFPVDRIPAPVPGRESESLGMLEKLLATGEFAACIFEPLIQGAGGMLMYSEAALDEIMRICRSHSVFSIADEVMTGFGRTGKPFALSGLESSADFICLSKGLTGGTMALGATATTAEVYQEFVSSSRMQSFLHGHTFTANPIACAAALASLDLFEKPECDLAIKRIIRCHRQFIESVQNCSRLCNIRHCGVVLALDLDSQDTGYGGSLRDNLYSFFIERGIILRPLGNTLYLMPPYCITDDQLEYIYASIVEAAARFSST